MRENDDIFRYYPNVRRGTMTSPYIQAENNAFPHIHVVIMCGEVIAGMKKLHLLWIIVASLLLISSVSWGFVWIFAAQDTIPKGVQMNISGDDSTGRSQESGSKKEILLKSGAAFTIGGLAIQAAIQELAGRQESFGACAAYNRSE